MGYRKCPICDLNYITEEEEMCEACLNAQDVKKTLKYSRRTPYQFNETFIFKNEEMKFRGQQGFKAYNSEGKNVGIVFMTKNQNTPADGNCELCFFEEFQDRYGEWHRIMSHGRRIKWEFLCEHLKTDSEYVCYVD